MISKTPKTAATHAIEFRTETQDWTRIQPERLYSGSRAQMQTLLEGQLAAPPFAIEGTEYRSVTLAGEHDLCPVAVTL